MTTESDPESVAVFQEIIAEYEADHPDIVIDIVLTPHGADHQRLVAAHTVGGDLGVITVHQEHLTDYVEAGWLLPIDDFVDAVGRDKFKPSSVLALKGHDYAVGYAAGTHGTLWVRKDLFDEAGLDLPTTYEEFLAAAEALTQDTDGDGKIDIYGIGIPAAANGATDARFISFVYQNCGDYFDKEGNLVFDRPEVLEALKNYVALLEYAPPGVTGWSWFDGITAFTAGKIAMHPYGGRLGYNLFRDKPEMRENTTVIWYPAGSKVKAGRGGYDYLAVSSQARWPEETLDFLTFFFTGDRLARFNMTVPGHLIPPTSGLEEAIFEFDHPYVQQYSEDIHTLFDSSKFNALPSVQMGAVDVETCTFDPAYNPMPWGAAIFGPALSGQMIERVVSGGESPEDAWEWAYTEMQRIADEWKAEHPDWKPVAGQ
jgi:ABC-type glycerol-3-phosphate transport system substrate-binding protein